MQLKWQELTRGPARLRLVFATAGLLAGLLASLVIAGAAVAGPHCDRPNPPPICGTGGAADELPPPPPPRVVHPLKIVAVGDSYASGEGAIDLGGAGWLNAACHRSALAGPRNAALRLNEFQPTSFESFACSGATTSSLLGPDGGQLGRLAPPPAMIDGLTISIGGNDLGFSGIVRTCLVADCLEQDYAVSVSLAALPARLAAVLSAVPANVRHVFVTEYPDPTTGVFGIRCGSPESPAFHGLESINPVEAAWAAVRVVGRLNATLAAAVDAANAAALPHPAFHFVTGISSRFAGHGYCTGGGSPAPWTWVNPRYIATPVDSFTSQWDPFGTMHPNDLGQQAIGEALAAAMRFLTA
jgi:hypothetical protein